MKREYEIVSYDVWGNAMDGFHVNQSFYTGEIVSIDPESSDYAINRKIGIRGVSWDGDPEFSLYGTIKRNGKPALELRAVNRPW